jgi:hypothetical protein
MTAIVYPPTLPGPSGGWDGEPIERRAVSALPSSAVAPRGRSRDRIEDIAAQWIYSPEEMAVWRAWYEDTLLDGCRWFAKEAPGVGGWVDRVLRFRTATVRREHLGAGIFRVSAQLQQRGRSALPMIEPLPTGFIGITEGATDGEDGGGAVEPPDDVVAGDGLVLAVVRQVGGTFGIGAGWVHIDTGQDSSGGLRIELYGRIADGTAADVATYTVSAGPTMFLMAALRNVDDANFPADMEEDTDYNISLAGVGACNGGGITKTTSAEQLALVIGFFESSEGVGGMALTAPPSGYTQAANQTMDFVIPGVPPITPDTPMNCQMLAGYRTFSGQSEDPGAFTSASLAVGVGGTGVALVVVTYQ